MYISAETVLSNVIQTLVTYKYVQVLNEISGMKDAFGMKFFIQSKI